MPHFDNVKNRLAQILDASLEQYPDIELSDANKVEFLSEWDDEVSMTCASVQEIFNAMYYDQINIERAHFEFELVKERYAGHNLDQLLDFLIEFSEKLSKLYEAVFAYKVKFVGCIRILRELEEAFWFEISYNLHGSSLSS